MGGSGRWPNNVERDLVSLLKLPVAPIWIELPVRNDVNRKEIEVKKLPILCPHSLYDYLFATRTNL